MRKLLLTLIVFTGSAFGQLDLDGFSATGTIYQQARITVQIVTRGNGQENLWASSAWQEGGVADPTGTLDEGSMTVTGLPGGLADIVIRRFARWDDSRDRLIINTTGTGAINQLFDNANDPYRLSIVREVSGTPTVMTWDPPSRGGSSGFIDWWRTGTTINPMSQNQWDFIDAIANGDSVIFAIHQGVASYTAPGPGTVIGYVGDIAIIREYVGDVEIVAEYIGDTEIHSR